MADRLTCWEFFGCDGTRAGHGREGAEPCPVYEETRLDGVHGGARGGRACWVVEGTRCGASGAVGYTLSMASCLDCSFFARVLAEEGDERLPDSLLRSMLG